INSAEFVKPLRRSPCGRSDFYTLRIARFWRWLLRMLSDPTLVQMPTFVWLFWFSDRPPPRHHANYVHCGNIVRVQSLRGPSDRLFWKKPDGTVYGYPSSLPRILGSSGRLLFATNGGMYHEDSSPVGLYVEQGRELVRANTNAGPGNFHMKPNGVFYVNGEV